MLLLLSFANETDRQKFEVLYDRYKKLLLYKAYGILGDYTLAEDATSEAFIRIYKNLHKIDVAQSKKTAAFVVTVVKNVSISMLNKNKRIKDTDQLNETIEDDFNLEENVLSLLNSEDIMKLIGQLGDELHDIFMMRYAYDMAYKEIGELLGLTENTVTVKIHRARKKLSTMLCQEGYVYE